MLLNLILCTLFVTIAIMLILIADLCAGTLAMSQIPLAMVVSNRLLSNLLLKLVVCVFHPISYHK